MDRVGLPESIRLSNGPIEPFEPERITRSLFAATEQLGTPNAFLAQELTEGVLHFLTADPGGSQISTEQLAELIAKIVRELGHPNLARAYELRQNSGRPERSAARPNQPVPWPDWFDPLASSLELSRDGGKIPIGSIQSSPCVPSGTRVRPFRGTDSAHDVEFSTGTRRHRSRGSVGFDF